MRIPTASALAVDAGLGIDIAGTPLATARQLPGGGRGVPTPAASSFEQLFGRLFAHCRSGIDSGARSGPSGSGVDNRHIVATLHGGQSASGRLGHLEATHGGRVVRQGLGQLDLAFFVQRVDRGLPLDVRWVHFPLDRDLIAIPRVQHRVHGRSIRHGFDRCRTEFDFLVLLLRRLLLMKLMRLPAGIRVMVLLFVQDGDRSAGSGSDRRRRRLMNFGLHLGADSAGGHG